MGQGQGPSKRWTLALCEGPERGCIQMHQDCLVGSLKDKESTRSKSDRGSSPTNTASTVTATDGESNTVQPGKPIISVACTDVRYHLYDS